MKNLFFAVFVFFSVLIFAENEPTLEAFFEKTLEEEKIFFNDCKKNSTSVNESSNKCDITERLSKSYNALNGKIPSEIDLLLNYTAPAKSAQVQPTYPRIAQERGIQGYVIVSFTILDNGETSDHVIVDSACGQFFNIFSSNLEKCDIFNRSALYAAKKLKYKPAKLNNKNVSVNEHLHRFTYLLSPDQTLLDSKEYKQLIKVDELNRNGKYSDAKKIAQKYSQSNKLFLVPLSQSELNLQNYNAAYKNISSYLEHHKKNDHHIPLEFVLRVNAIYVESMYELQMFEELIIFEQEFFRYLNENEGRFNKSFASAYLYYALAFANKGDVFNTAYYLNEAFKYSNSEGQRNFISDYSKRISNFL